MDDELSLTEDITVNVAEEIGAYYADQIHKYLDEAIKGITRQQNVELRTLYRDPRVSRWVKLSPHATIFNGLGWRPYKPWPPQLFYEGSFRATECAGMRLNIGVS